MGTEADDEDVEDDSSRAPGGLADLATPASSERASMPPSALASQRPSAPPGSTKEVSFRVSQPSALPSAPPTAPGGKSAAAPSADASAPEEVEKRAMSFWGKALGKVKAERDLHRQMAVEESHNVKPSAMMAGAMSAAAPPLPAAPPPAAAAVPASHMSVKSLAAGLEAKGSSPALGTALEAGSPSTKLTLAQKISDRLSRKDSRSDSVAPPEPAAEIM